jgi:hypothetical protein
MKILFLCTGFELGKDGVGDYTRRIAAELIRRNYTVGVIAMNDKYVAEKFESVEFAQDVKMPVMRLPAIWSEEQRIAETQKFVSNFNPDWLSLQFVIYGFHKKGLPFRLGKQLSRLGNKTKWHIMFHELWVGEELGVSIKTNILGYLQRRIILDLINVIKPAVISTSIPLYQLMLHQQHVESTLLPLFSNIKNEESYSLSIEEEESIPAWVKTDRNSLLIGCVFGSFYNESWDMSSLLTQLVNKSKQADKKTVICSIGNMASGKAAWEALPNRYPEIIFITLGKKNETFISYWLNNYTDFGILTTPAVIAGKSGSFMAFKEHGVPCYCKENELEFNPPLNNNFIDDYLSEVRTDSSFVLPVKKKCVHQLADTVNLLTDVFENV